MPRKPKPKEVGQKGRRPWGSFEILAKGGEYSQLYQVKRIIVKPGQRLSLQSHSKRSEVWICVKGCVKVECDGETHILSASFGDPITIPQNAKHRMHNEKGGEAIIIEVQTGSYLGEDDITRYEDDYGRKD